MNNRLEVILLQHFLGRAEKTTETSIMILMTALTYQVIVKVKVYFEFKQIQIQVEK
jgi:hypothetical protein